MPSTFSISTGVAKPVLNTEGSVFGYKASEGVADPHFKRSGDLIKLYVLHASRGIQKFCWFANWGIFTFARKKLRPMAPLVAYAVMTSILEKSHYRGRVPTKEPDICACVFEREWRPTLVIWHKLPGRNSKARLPFGPAQARIADRPGRASTHVTANDMLELVVTDEPVFVLGGGKELLSEARALPRQRAHEQLIAEIKENPGAENAPKL